MLILFKAVLRRQPLPVQGPMPYRVPANAARPGGAAMSPLVPRGPVMPVSPSGPQGPSPVGPVGPAIGPVYGPHNERQRLIPVNQPVPVSQIPESQVRHATQMRASPSLQYCNGAPMSNGFIPNNPVSAVVHAPAPGEADIAPNYATVIPRNNPVRVMGNPPSPSHSLNHSSSREERPIVRVNTYDCLENCDVDQTFFAGEHRIHLDSMEYERTRTNGPPPRDTPTPQRSRSHEEAPTPSKLKEVKAKPAPPLRKTPVQVIANQSSTFVEPMSLDDFPPPPPYTETDPVAADPAIADNLRNIIKVQCYA